MRFLGHLDEVGVRRLMHVGDVVVFPSLAAFGEGFGLAALEASAAGRPVVAAAVASLPEIVVDGTTGVLVASGDADALATALVDLARDPAARARMGAAGHGRAATEFTLPRWSTRRSPSTTRPCTRDRTAGGHPHRPPRPPARLHADRIVAKALRHAGAAVVDLGDDRRFPARWWTSAARVAAGVTRRGRRLDAQSRRRARRPRPRLVPAGARRLRRASIRALREHGRVARRGPRRHPGGVVAGAPGPAGVPAGPPRARRHRRTPLVPRGPDRDRRLPVHATLARRRRRRPAAAPGTVRWAVPGPLLRDVLAAPRRRAHRPRCRPAPPGPRHRGAHGGEWPHRRRGAAARASSSA